MTMTDLGFCVTVVLLVVGPSFLAAQERPPKPAGCQSAAALTAKARELPTDPAALPRQLGLYREAVRLCPTDAEVQNGLGDTLEKLGHLDGAEDAYRRASELRANWPYPYFGLGDVCRRTNRPDEALYWYRKGLALEPGDEETLRQVGLLTAADPAGLVDSRSIAKLFDRTRGPGTAESIALDERLVPFDYDSAKLRPDAHAQLREIAHALWDVLGTSRGIRVVPSAPSMVMEVAGHTDRRGTDEFNIYLGRRRAQAVAEELVSAFGIPRDRLQATTYGRSRPVCSEETEACHARNRRVEIRAR